MSDDKDVQTPPRERKDVEKALIWLSYVVGDMGVQWFPFNKRDKEEHRKLSHENTDKSKKLRIVEVIAKFLFLGIHSMYRERMEFMHNDRKIRILSFHKFLRGLLGEWAGKSDVVIDNWGGLISTTTPH